MAAVPGEVAYRWSPWRYAFAMAAIGFAAAVVACFLLSLLFSALTGDLRFPPIFDGILFVGLYTFFFAVFSVLLARRKPSWLRFGDEGIELAAAGRDAVRVPGPAVASARVRWVWPLAAFEVFVGPGDESQVAVAGRGGRQPLRRRKGRRLCFSVPLAGLGASAATVRSELRSRGLTDPTDETGTGWRPGPRDRG